MVGGLILKVVLRSVFCQILFAKCLADNEGEGHFHKYFTFKKILREENPFQKLPEGMGPIPMSLIQQRLRK